MSKPYEQFLTNIDHTSNLSRLYELTIEKFPDMDLTDLLRAEIVMGVSNLDHYIHEIIREEAIEMAQGRKQKTDEYMKKFNSILSSMPDGYDEQYILMWMTGEITDVLKQTTYQNPKIIIKGMKIISDADLWAKIAEGMHETENDLKVILLSITNRRNSIVHNSDITNMGSSIQNPIELESTKASTAFLKRLVQNIDKVVTDN